MNSIFRKLLTGMILVVAIVHAQQWAEVRRIVEHDMYCPGGAVTLEAFEMVPRINTIPFSLRSVKEYVFSDSGDTVLHTTSIFTYNQVQQCLASRIIENSNQDTMNGSKYFFDGERLAGYSFGSSDRRVNSYLQMLSFKNGMPLRYESSHAAGGDLFTSSKAVIDYFAPATGGSCDSMQCLFRFSSNRGGSRTVEASYRLQFGSDSIVDGISGRSVYVYIHYDTVRNDYIEKISYRFDPKKRPVEALYIISDTQTNLVYQKKRYEYAYGASGIEKETFSEWVDSTGSFVPRIEATHAYDPQGRPQIYHRKDLRYDSQIRHEYDYDSLGRVKTHVVINKYSNGFGDTSLQRWSYESTTPIIPAQWQPGVLQREKVSVRIANNTIRLLLSQPMHPGTQIRLFSINGRLIETHTDVVSRSAARHEIVIHPVAGVVAKGLFIVTIERDGMAPITLVTAGR